MSVTPNQLKALYELSRHLAFHPETPESKELSDTIKIIIESENGSRAYKLIGDWKTQSEEYLIENAKQY